VVNHTYPAAGVYTAVVTASNSVSVLTDTTTVTVEEAVAGLAVTNDSPTPLGSATTLSATVTSGSNETYAWAFGDGATDSGAVVSHTYPAIGVYTAVVTASNGVSVLTDTTTVVIADRTRLYLPVIVSNRPTAGPDLVVDSVTVTGSNVQVVIRNQGNASVQATDGFWVDFYVNPNPPPTKVNDIWNDGRSAQGMAWGVTAPALPLEPGGVIVLTNGGDYYWSSLSNFTSLTPGSLVYAHVDSANALTNYGGVLENHEIAGGEYNNIGSPVYIALGFSDVDEKPAEMEGTRPPDSANHLPLRP
jgi:hypothetical protein